MRVDDLDTKELIDLWKQCEGFPVAQKQYYDEIVLRNNRDHDPEASQFLMEQRR